MDKPKFVKGTAFRAGDWFILIYTRGIQYSEYSEMSIKLAKKLGIPVPELGKRKSFWMNIQS